MESQVTRTKEEIEQRELARQRRTVIGLIEGGQLGKAMGRVTSHGLADIEKLDVRACIKRRVSLLLVALTVMIYWFKEICTISCDTLSIIIRTVRPSNLVLHSLILTY